MIPTSYPTPQTAPNLPKNVSRFLRFRLRRSLIGITLAGLGLSSVPAEAQRYSWGAQNPWIIESDTPLEIQEVESFQVGMIGSYLLTHKPGSMTMYYSGPRSLSAEKKTMHALSATAFMGLRLWKGAEFYYNAGFLYASPPGVEAGVSNPLPGLYAWPAAGGHQLHSPKIYFRQTFALPSPGNRAHENRIGHFNQLAGYDPVNYLRLHLGKFSLGEVFDRNPYTEYPYSSFLFWSLQQNGAWDRPQNILGHSFGLVAELELNGLNIKAGAATLPEHPLGMAMNQDLTSSLAGMMEVSHRYRFFSQPGQIRLMSFLNTGMLSNYQHALDHAVDAEKDPDLAPVRRLGQYKFGFLFHWDQSISSSMGLFLKLGWNNGQTESAYFVEVDQTLTLGSQIWGEGWKRPGDLVGIGLVANRISEIHRQYLAWGGITKRLGEGQFHYGDEFLGELFYRCRLVPSKKLWLTGNYRLAINPGYHQGRAPASWFSLRVDLEI